jgi:hypothetical protein
MPPWNKKKVKPSQVALASNPLLLSIGGINFLPRQLSVLSKKESTCSELETIEIVTEGEETSKIKADSSSWEELEEGGGEEKEKEKEERGTERGLGAGDD